MDNLVRLWNARGHKQLRRHWIEFKDRIAISGETPEQVGVLTLQPAGAGGLSARLQVMGNEFMLTIAPGNDIDVWINGLELFVGVKAVTRHSVLLVFGIAHGVKVNVTLEVGDEIETQALATADASRQRQTRACSAGLCQTRN